MKRAEIDPHQIVRRTIDRDRVGAAEAAGTEQQRLVVAGEQPFGIVAVDHEIRAEVALEEITGLVRRTFRRRRRIGADRRQSPTAPNHGPGPIGVAAPY